MTAVISPFRAYSRATTIFFVWWRWSLHVKLIPRAFSVRTIFQGKRPGNKVVLGCGDVSSSKSFGSVGGGEGEISRATNKWLLEVKVSRETVSLYWNWHNTYPFCHTRPPNSPSKKGLCPNNIASTADKLLCELHRKAHKSLRSVILLDKVASTPTTIRGNEPLTDEEDDDEVDATAASKKHQVFALAWENSRHSWRHYWGPCEMTSEERVQKFNTDDATLPKSGRCVWLAKNLP